MAVSFMESASIDQYIASQDIFSLAHSVKIIVPSTRNASQLMTESQHDKWINAVTKAMGMRFGGATIRHSTGAYYSDIRQRLIIEPVAEIESSVSDISLPTVRFMFKLAQRIASALNQESVAVYIDHTLYFVES